MKRVLFVGDTESIHIAKYVNFFVDRDDYDVYIATFSHKNCTKCSKVFFLSSKQITAGGGNYHYIFSVKKLANVIRKYKPNYINAHYSYSMGFIALLALNLSKVKSELSIVCHGSDVMAYPNMMYKYLNKIVLSRSVKIIAVSVPMYHKLVEWGINSKKIFVGQYGVKVLPFTPYKRDIDIISIRDYSPNSRIDEMLENISQLCGIECKKVVFVIPGIEKNNFDNLKKRYPNIQFYGRLSHEVIINLLKRSKIYVSATKSDGTSLSLIEAMVYGAYPVISDILTNCYWVKDGINGRLFNNFDNFKKFLKESMNLSSDKLENVRNINYALIDCKCNYKKQMPKIEKFLFE